MSAFQANDESSILSARTKENRDPSDLYFLWYRVEWTQFLTLRAERADESSIKQRSERKISLLILQSEEAFYLFDKIST